MSNLTLKSPAALLAAIVFAVGSTAVVKSSSKSAFKLVTFVVELTVNGAVPVAIVEVNLGAVATPVKVGFAVGDLVVTTLVTNSVVAICVVEVPAVAVGAVGVPVNAGDALGAFALS